MSMTLLTLQCLILNTSRAIQCLRPRVLVYSMLPEYEYAYLVMYNLGRLIRHLESFTRPRGYRSEFETEFEI